MFNELMTEVKGAVKNILAEEKAQIQTDKTATELFSSNDKKADKDALNKSVRELLEKTAFTKANLTTGTTTPYGGYTIDQELYREIVHLTGEYGVARQEMFLTPMNENSLVIPTQATDLSVSWVDEAGSITSTNPVFGKATLTAKKVVANVVISRELIQDTAVNLFAYLSERVAEGFAKAEDDQFFAGDGTVFSGILNQAIGVNTVEMAAGKTAATDLTADDLLNMQDETPVASLRNGKYFLHRSILNVVRKLKDVTSGQYIYSRPSEGTPATIWDKPIVLVEAMPTKDEVIAEAPFVIFGDLKKACWMGYRQGIEMEQTNAVHWANDLVDVRFTERVGFTIVLASALTLLFAGEETSAQ